jgi:methionyl-tRNA synthetase
LPLPDRVLVHGFVTAEGRKIGKSLGNAVDPFEVIGRFGADAVRYYLLRAIPPFGDGDFSVARLEELYRSDLAGGVGNLVSRLASLCAKAGVTSWPPGERPEAPAAYVAAIEAFEFDKALEVLWQILTGINQDIAWERPWELDEGARLHELLERWLGEIWRLASWLEAFLPDAYRGIVERLFSGPVGKAPPLFPRV